MELYPLKLESVNKEIIWGGTLLCEKYGKPNGRLAEAWELSVHPEGVCRILNGKYSGMLLSEYLGSDKNFPIMIKLIDACDKLSIQVHPVKTEMWYIVEAKPGARLVYGLKESFNEASFRSALESGKTEELLCFKEVKAGDVFFIPQGMIHAIGEGILIAEIQENSNITYRVYDYDRLQNGKPRELHIDNAINTVKDFTEEEIERLRYASAPESKRPRESSLACCPSFISDIYELKGSLTLSADDSFISIICIDGCGTVGGEPIARGDSYFIPKGLGKLEISAEYCKIITTTI